MEAPIGKVYPYKPTPGYPCSMEIHKYLLGNEMPIIEGIANLDKITKSRVYYIGLPIRTKGMDSSRIRAIVLEEKWKPEDPRQPTIIIRRSDMWRREKENVWVRFTGLRI